MRRIIPLLFLALVFVLPRTVFAAGGARVHAMLVIASNQKGESDRRLSAYVPTLRTILRFESYRLAGEGTANVGGGKQTLNLGNGHSLELEGDGKGGRLNVNWKHGGRSVMNTGLMLTGKPAVLGGPSTGNGDEVYAVIVVAD